MKPPFGCFTQFLSNDHEFKILFIIGPCIVLYFFFHWLLLALPYKCTGRVLHYPYSQLWWRHYPYSRLWWRHYPYSRLWWRHYPYSRLWWRHYPYSRLWWRHYPYSGLWWCHYPYSRLWWCHYPYSRFWWCHYPYSRLWWHWHFCWVSISGSVSFSKMWSFTLKFFIWWAMCS